MRAVVRTLLMLSLFALLAAPASAKDKDARKEKARKARQQAKKDRFAAVIPFLSEVELTDDQKSKLAELRKEHGPKLAELRKKRAGIITDEQKQARRQAFREARAAGKSKREAVKAARAAVELTDEQKKQLAELRKAYRAAIQEVRGKVMALLTDDQKEQIKQARQERRRKARKKREKAADSDE